MRREQESAAGRGLEEAARVGELLRERRLSRGLTLEEVGRAIRFGSRHVRAVEEGRFEQLPPPPYGRGLISAYASLVGIEPEELLRVCATALPPPRGGKRERIFWTPIRERVTWRDWTVPTALAVGLVTMTVAHVVLAPEQVELVAPSGGTSVASRPVQPVQPAGAGGAAETGVPAAVQPEPEPGAPGVRVTLRCEGSTWVEAAADGSEMRRYELGPGELLELTARERLSVSLGDAGVVRVRVGERELGFIGDKGETRNGMSFVAPRASAAAGARPVEGD